MGEMAPGLADSFTAITVGYLANNVLPARAGEVVRSYILVKRQNLTVGAVLATVTMERVAKLVIVLVMASLVLLAGPFPTWAAKAIPALVIAGVLSLALLLALRVSGD